MGNVKLFCTFAVARLSSSETSRNQGSVHGGFQTVVRVLSGDRFPQPPLNLNVTSFFTSFLPCFKPEFNLCFAGNLQPWYKPSEKTGTAFLCFQSLFRRVIFLWEILGLGFHLANPPKKGEKYRILLPGQPPHIRNHNSSSCFIASIFG